jgi:hypothetical protein
VAHGLELAVLAAHAEGAAAAVDYDSSAMLDRNDYDSSAQLRQLSNDSSAQRAQ